MVQQSRTGKLVFISSTLGLMTLPGYGSYVPAKHALRGLADMLSVELMLYDIDVHIYFPPTMYTPGYKVENMTKPRLTLEFEADDTPLTPEEAARILIKGTPSWKRALSGLVVDSGHAVTRCQERAVPDHG